MKIMIKCVVLALTVTGTIFAQTSISGTVSDESGNALPGANVIILGTNLGAAANLDGSYQIDVPADQATGQTAVLEASFVGYTTQTANVVLTAGATIERIFLLPLDVVALRSVVVTALGFRANADEQGSTSSKVEGFDMIRSGETLVANSLAAKASNVIINSTVGDPGAGTSIKIRGQNTISGASQPLIILDGVPIMNSTTYGGGNNITGGRSAGVTQQSRINDINASDIESVQVLKGAAAAALWGSRAANGVLVITTKTGAPGKLRINYKRTKSFDEVHERIPMQTTWGQGRGGSYSPTRAESWGDYIPDRTGGADEIDQTGEYFEAEGGNIYYPIDTRNSKDTFVDTNWDAVFQTGGFDQDELQISGGTSTASFLLSYARLRQEGIIRDSNLDRDNLRMNTRFTLSDWMSVVSKASYTGSSSNRIQQSSNTTGLLLGLLRTPPDFDNRDYKGTYYDDDGFAFERHRAYRRYLGHRENPTYNNPLWTVFEQKSTSEVSRFIMSNELNIEPGNNMSLIFRGGIDRSNDRRVYFFPVGSASTRNSGRFAEDMIDEQELNFDVIGRSSLDIGAAISINATLGWNINDRQRFINNAELSGFLVSSDKQTANLNTSSESSEIGNSRRFIRSNRTYGIASIALMDQLYINLSGALENSSSIKGSFFYPSFDLAYQFTNLVRATPISFGKLRLSWGQVGVQPNPHRFETLAESGFTYSTYSDPLEVGLFGGGYRVDDDKGNEDLKPEIKTENEIGMDFRFFDDRLSFGFTSYRNQIDDMLINVALSPSSGYDTQYSNAASMKNEGFEFDGDWSIIRSQGREFGLTFNWSKNENEVLDLAGTDVLRLGTGSVNSVAKVGYAIGALFGTGSQTDENGALILNDDGFPQITSTPIILGDPNPDWRGIIGSRARLGGFSFNILLEHSQGGDYSPRTQWVLRRFGTTEETANLIESTPKDLVNYNGDTIAAGTRVRGNVHDFGGGDVLLDETWYRTGIGGGFGDNQAYNFSIKDATFTRLREITVAYTLSSQAFTRMSGLRAVTITATGRNLFLWAPDLVGIDPMVNQAGVANGFGLDYFTNPSTKSFVISISANY